MIRINQWIPESVVDGPGIRTAVFLQGCAHRCKGCHNPETWKFDAGEEYTPERFVEQIKSYPIGKHITLTGGDPVYQWQELCQAVEYLYMDGYRFGMYTGFTMEELWEMAESSGWEEYPPNTKCPIFRPEKFSTFLLRMDWIVTDPFIEEQRTLDLPFRGSRNQRVFEVKYNNCRIQKEDITAEWDADYGNKSGIKSSDPKFIVNTDHLRIEDIIRATQCDRLTGSVTIDEEDEDGCDRQ